MNQNLITRVKVDHWTDPECVSHAQAGLLYRDSWPTYIGFHSFLCAFICLQFGNFFIAFSLGQVFIFVFLVWRILVL